MSRYIHSTFSLQRSFSHTYLRKFSKALNDGEDLYRIRFYNDATALVAAKHIVCITFDEYAGCIERMKSRLPKMEFEKLSRYFDR